MNPKTASAGDLLAQAADIFSHQAIADQTGIARETICRWLKKGDADQGMTVSQYHRLQALLPAPVSGPRHFTFIDLFAGIGGLRRAFEGIGGRCVFTSEWDRFAVKTYRANYHCDHPIQGDIREITQPAALKDQPREAVLGAIRARMPAFDVLLGGFPCQPFSSAGMAKKRSLGRATGFEDETQGTLFFDVARIIEATQPKVLVLENVKNLKSHDKGNTYRVIIETLESLGYVIANHPAPATGRDPVVIDASHFVPQHRERVVLVAFRADLNLHEGFDLAAIRDYFPERPPRLGDILESHDDVDPRYTLSDKLWSYLQAHAAKHKARGNGFGFGLVGPHQIARTLSARYGKDGSEILIDQGEGRNPRRLTPLECSRLMGFSSAAGSEFVIPVSDTQAYHQFGNSVAVPVFAAVAKMLRERILTAVKQERKAA